jgi:hypothetical protein
MGGCSGEDRIGGKRCGVRAFTKCDKWWIRRVSNLDIFDSCGDDGAPPFLYLHLPLLFGAVINPIHKSGKSPARFRTLCLCHKHTRFKITNPALALLYFHAFYLASEIYNGVPHHVASAMPASSRNFLLQGKITDSTEKLSSRIINTTDDHYH